LTVLEKDTARNSVKWQELTVRRKERCHPEKGIARKSSGTVVPSLLWVNARQKKVFSDFKTAVPLELVL
jgi:hypothetical protein